MKSIIDKDGNFMFTFEGGDINLDDPSLEGCTIIEGDSPLQELHQKMKEEADAAVLAANAERDHEHAHLASLEQRIAGLESRLDG
jgi:hypothetical protein